MSFFDKISEFLFGGGTIAFRVTTVSGRVYNARQPYIGVPEGDYINEAKREVRHAVMYQTGEDVKTIEFVSHTRK